MKKKIFSTGIAVLVINILLAIITYFTQNSIALSLTITSGTVLFHLVIRLIIGYTVPRIFNYKQKYFAEKSFEKKLYKTLRVKKWKKHMPSYNPDTYSVERHSYEEIANTMCRNEVIHTIDVIVSFIPLLFTIYAGAFFVFLITSILAAMFDGALVIMQRYNRPRIVKLINRSKR